MEEPKESPPKGEVLELVLYPDKILSEKCVEVADFGEGLQKLLSDMQETLMFYKGAGLAAPQVGSNLSVLITMLDHTTDALEVVVFVNPKVVERKGEQLVLEGCLSFPGARAQVRRAQEITVACQNQEGKSFEVSATGWEASVLQHEIDHLEGKVFLDRMSPFQRTRALKGYRKKMGKLFKEAKREGLYNG